MIGVVLGHFAEESANLTQQNIIEQAASSMLMQANPRPQLGLKQLRLVNSFLRLIS